jgi:pyridoxamine 5'-phosphate oxidase
VKNLENLRKDYQLGELNKEHLTKNPMDMFALWWHHTIEAGLEEPNAMTLATSNQAGQPSARTVLLKGTTNEGFEFFTNYESHKAKDIEENPKVALLFFWQKLERQVRIEGYAEKVDPARSAAYFQSRPHGSQIGAWASPQSQVIANRTVIENKLKAIEEKYKGKDPLPAPPHWGGYLVKPELFEFWQGRDNRLHDRFRYVKNASSGWTIERLAP